MHLIQFLVAILMGCLWKDFQRCVFPHFESFLPSFCLKFSFFCLFFLYSFFWPFSPFLPTCFTVLYPHVFPFFSFFLFPSFLFVSFFQTLCYRWKTLILSAFPPQCMTTSVLFFRFVLC